MYDLPTGESSISSPVDWWSDCNRAAGHIYRFEDIGGTDANTNGANRKPGETLVVWVDPDEWAAFYERRFGTP